MAATDLNTVRSTIEARLATELASSPAIPVVFNNMTFDSTAEDTFVQCITSFGANSYITQGGTTDSDNLINGFDQNNLHHTNSNLNTANSDNNQLFNNMQVNVVMLNRDGTTSNFNFSQQF